MWCQASSAADSATKAAEARVLSIFADGGNGCAHEHRHSMLSGGIRDGKARALPLGSSLPGSSRGPRRSPGQFHQHSFRGQKLKHGWAPGMPPLCGQALERTPLSKVSARCNRLIRSDAPLRVRMRSVGAIQARAGAASCAHGRSSSCPPSWQACRRARSRAAGARRSSRTWRPSWSHIARPGPRAPPAHDSRPIKGPLPVAIELWPHRQGSTPRRFRAAACEKSRRGWVELRPGCCIGGTVLLRNYCCNYRCTATTARRDCTTRYGNNQWERPLSTWSLPGVRLVTEGIR